MKIDTVSCKCLHIFIVTPIREVGAVIKVILLLHFFKGKDFIGQKMEWVELSFIEELGALITLLGQGNKPADFHGNLDFPSGGQGYQRIQNALKSIFFNHFCEAAPERKEGSRRWNWEDADCVRVSQIIQGWPWAKPSFSPV